MPRAVYNRVFTRTKVSISSSLGTEDLRSEDREGDLEQRSRDSFESGYSSGAMETVTKVLYYNEISAVKSGEEVAVNVDS